MSSKIEKAARTLLGTLVFCSLLATTGCGVTSGGSGAPHKAEGDWAMSLLAGFGTTGVGMFPAKYTFDVNAAPDCANDFVAYNTSLTGSVTSANIVAFNQLYSTQGTAGGLCNQDGPSVYWSYFTGTGQALTSVVLFRDGSKVAFVENAGGGATLRILKWKAGEGTGPGAPATPTTLLTAGQNWTDDCPADNSCMASIALSGSTLDTRSAPFFDYSNDVLYVGDNSGTMHKFTGVFEGTPAEVTTGVWPMEVNAATILTGPVYDSISGNIYVGDNSGQLSYIREASSTVGECQDGFPPCLGSLRIPVGPVGGGSVVDAPIVDGTTGFVFAVNGNEPTNNGTILQASTDFTTSVLRFDIGGAAFGSELYGGSFDETYFQSSPGAIAGHMYVCGKDNTGGPDDRPAIYQLSFDVNGVLTSVGTPLLGLVDQSNTACSPVTAVYNPNGGGTGEPREWIFFSVGRFASNANPIPATSTCRAGFQTGPGCIISIDVTGNPSWPQPLATAIANARAMPANITGSTSGIVVDNVADSATSPEASSIYLSYGGPSTATEQCNGVTGVGCAVKLTQAALQ